MKNPIHMFEMERLFIVRLRQQSEYGHSNGAV